MDNSAAEAKIEFTVKLFLEPCAFISACPLMAYPWRRFVCARSLNIYCATVYAAFTIETFKHAVAGSFSKLAAVKCFKLSAGPGHFGEITVSLSRTVPALGMQSTSAPVAPKPTGMNATASSSSPIAAVEPKPSVWIEIGAVLIGGVGFLSDACKYRIANSRKLTPDFICRLHSIADDLFVINLVMVTMATIYPQARLRDALNFRPFGCPKHAQSTQHASLTTTFASVGAICGQLVFGNLADIIGRRVIFITTISLASCFCSISLRSSLVADFAVYAFCALLNDCCWTKQVMAGSVSSAVVFDNAHFSIYLSLMVRLRNLHLTVMSLVLQICQFVLGFGVGGEFAVSSAEFNFHAQSGEYPLSATISSENAIAKKRGRTVSNARCCSSCCCVFCISCHYNERLLLCSSLVRVSLQQVARVCRAIVHFLAEPLA